MKIEIFKSGTHVTANGREIVFSNADVEAIANNYDINLHEAPLVVGHPKDNSPAFGWAKSLEAVNEGGVTKLYADIEPTPNFTETLENKHYKKVSAALYSPNDTNNPNKGSYSLRHIGALGASPPAIKGLEAFNFNDDGNYLNFLEYDNPFKRVITIFSNIRDWFIAEEGQDTADEVIPKYEIDFLRDKAGKVQLNDDNTDFSEKIKVMMIWIKKI